MNKKRRVTSNSELEPHRMRGDAVSDSSLTCNMLLTKSCYLSVMMSHRTHFYCDRNRRHPSLCPADFKLRWHTLTHFPPSPSTPPSFSLSRVNSPHLEEVLKANLCNPHLSDFCASVLLGVFSCLFCAPVTTQWIRWICCPRLQKSQVPKYNTNIIALICNASIHLPPWQRDHCSTEPMLPALGMHLDIYIFSWIKLNASTGDTHTHTYIKDDNVAWIKVGLIFCLFHTQKDASGSL